MNTWGLHRWCCGALLRMILAACVLLWPVGATAEQVRVLVVSERPSQLLACAISEVEAAGLSVMQHTPVNDEASRPNQLLVEAQRRQARGVLRVTLSAIEVWTVTASPSRLVFLDSVSSNNPAEDRVTAVRALEVLRAAALFSSTPEESPVSLPKQPVLVIAPPAPMYVAPLPRRVAAFLGPAVLASPGGVPPIALANVTLGYELSGLVELAGSVSVPVMSSTIRQPEGEATVRLSVVGSTARIRFRSLSPRIVPFVGAGVAAGIWGVDGRANPPYVSGSKTLLAPLLVGMVGMVLPVSEAMSVRSELQVGSTTAEFNVGFVGSSRASWGGGVVGGSIGIEARF